MWSLAQRLRVSLVHNVQMLKSATGPVTNLVESQSRTFGLLSSRTPPSTINVPVSGVAGIVASPHQFLRPRLTLLTQLCNGFKIKGRLKRRCKDCYFVVRQERTYVMCKSHGRHKQMSMKKSEKNTWILTDATQSKFRAW